MSNVDFKEELHPRASKGQHGGGQFVHKALKSEEEALPRQRGAQPQAKELQKGKGPLHDGLQGLTEREDTAVSFYTDRNDQANREMNRKLRSGTTPVELGAAVQMLESLTHRGRLSKDTVVYRAVDKNFIDAIDAMQKGEVLRDDGFMSTSLVQPKDKPAMRIKASQESHGLMIGAHGVAETPSSNKDEILFERGSRLIYEGKGSDGVHEFTLDQDVTTDGTGLNGAVIDVGGDMWNRETAVRLEREYVEAKPQIEQAITELTGGEAEETSMQPTSWDMFSNDDQEKIADHWKEGSFESMHESEVENWYSENAYPDAVAEITQEFMLKGEEEDDKWITDALTDHIEGVFDETINEQVDSREQKGLPRIPFSIKTLVRALNLHQSNADNSKVDIDFDDKELMPEGYSEAQMTLPGIEELKPSDLLTDEMRNDLRKVIEEALGERAEEKKEKMDPPEYLNESAQEMVDEQWDELSDDEKFEYATHVGFAEKGTVITVESPDSFDVDPLEEDSDSEDYTKTQALMRSLSIHRAMQLLKERGIKGVSSAGDLRDMDKDLWDGWKASSHGTEGKIMQAAIADELGGRLRETGLHGVDIDETKSDANRYGGGFDAVKALVRAKWETTQYMLDLSKHPTVDLYRAVGIDAVRRVEGKPWTVSKVTEGDEAGQWKAQGGKGEAFYFDTEDEAQYEADRQQAKSLPRELKWAAFHYSPTKWIVIQGRQPDDQSINQWMEGKEEGKSIFSFDNQDAADKLAMRKSAELALTIKGPKIEEIKGYMKLPDLVIERNGAASTSTDRSICNNWSDPETRVVLRARVPRTAIVSVPAYGQNVHSEHETVVAGTAWVGWDAWKKEAPSFNQVPF